MTWHDLTHDMTRHDRACHDMTSHDMSWPMTWHDMTGHVMTWHDITWHVMTHDMKDNDWYVEDNDWCVKDHDWYVKDNDSYVIDAWNITIDTWKITIHTLVSRCHMLLDTRFHIMTWQKHQFSSMKNVVQRENVGFHRCKLLASFSQTCARGKGWGTFGRCLCAGNFESCTPIVPNARF